MKGGEKRRKEMNIINDETNPSKARFTAGTTRNIDRDQIDFLKHSKLSASRKSSYENSFRHRIKGFASNKQAKFMVLFDASDPISTEIDQE